MEKSSQIAWKIVPLRHFFPLKVVPLIEVLLYLKINDLSHAGTSRVSMVACMRSRMFVRFLYLHSQGDF
jgi:hypothetical protein